MCGICALHEGVLYITALEVQLDNLYIQIEQALFQGIRIGILKPF